MVGTFSTFQEPEHRTNQYTRNTGTQYKSLPVHRILVTIHTTHQYTSTQNSGHNTCHTIVHSTHLQTGQKYTNNTVHISIQYTVTMLLLTILFLGANLVTVLSFTRVDSTGGREVCVVWWASIVNYNDSSTVGD